MVVGVGVNVYAVRVKGEGLPCDVSSHHLNLGFAMYASYFCLFAHFFYKAYLQKKKMMMKELGRGQTKAD
jgi:elongation of very long chain fatty acids protein 6